MSDKFYCYSTKLLYFIKSFGISYISTGFNPSSHNKFYVFPKSEKLDQVIALYNEVKHSL